jgi:hypothetical protein
MGVTRRDLIRLAAAAPILSAAKSLSAAHKPPPPPSLPSGGTRLYPTSALPQWWTTEPVSGWTYPNVNQTPDFVSLGAGPTPDGATHIQNVRNTPQAGAFTRAYFQMSTRPLQGSQTLGGVVSAAIHCIEGNAKINALLALQVVVHRLDGTVRGIALQVSQDTLEFPTDLAKSRAAQNWPLAAVNCLDGDVIAINIGLSANNQAKTLGYGAGFYLYANQLKDISFLDDPQLANTWVEFSTPLIFY